MPKKKKAKICYKVVSVHDGVYESLTTPSTSKFCARYEIGKWLIAHPATVGFFVFEGFAYAKSFALAQSRGSGVIWGLHGLAILECEYRGKLADCWYRALCWDTVRFTSLALRRPKWRRIFLREPGQLSTIFSYATPPGTKSIRMLRPLKVMAVIEQIREWLDGGGKNEGAKL